MYSLALPYFIYACAVFFFLRFLYLRSFADAEKRRDNGRAVLRMLIFIPAGFQGILLFCCSFLQILFATGLMNIYGDMMLSPLRIVLTGSLLLTGNLLIAKASAGIKGAAGIFCKIFTFCLGLWLLSLLVKNISGVLSFSLADSSGINYCSNLLVVPGAALVLFCAFLKGEWIYSRQSSIIKYFSLAAKLILLLVCIAFAVKFIFRPYSPGFL